MGESPKNDQLIKSLGGNRFTILNVNAFEMRLPYFLIENSGD